MGIFNSIKKLRTENHLPKISKDEINAMKILFSHSKEDIKNELKKLIDYEESVKSYVSSLRKIIRFKESSSKMEMTNSIFKIAKNLMKEYDKYNNQLKFLEIKKETLLKKSNKHNIHLDPHSPLMNFINQHKLNKMVLEVDVDGLKEEVKRLTA